MEARLLPMGDTAVLVEVADTDAALALRTALVHVLSGPGVSDRRWEAVDELVVGAQTLLVRVTDPARLDAVGAATLEVALATTVEPAGSSTVRVVEVPVVYDGPDLDEVARLTGLTPDAVISAH